MTNDQTANTVRVTCPHCGAVLETDGEIDNTRVECPACGSAFTPTAEPVGQGSRRIPKKWLFIAGALVLLALVWGLGKRGKGGGVGFTLSVRNKDVVVEPTLRFRSEEEYIKNFSGIVKSGEYEFRKNDAVLTFFNEVYDGFQPRYRFGLFQFSSPSRPFWSLYTTASPGYPEAYVWERDDGYFLKDHPKHSEKMRLLGIGAGYSNPVSEIPENTLFPAPVVVSYGRLVGHGTCYLYLNEAGSPSVLEWSHFGWKYFACHEGARDLAIYAKCLRELREKLVQYTEKESKEQAGEHSEAFEVKNKPVVYIGHLVEGYRERADIQYEFVVKPRGLTYSTNTTFIKEIRTTQRGTHTLLMDLEEIDRKIKQFSMFDDKKSTKKAFEPLYAFLSWKRGVYVVQHKPEKADGQERERSDCHDEDGQSTGSARKRQDEASVPETQERPQSVVASADKKEEPRQQTEPSPEKTTPKELSPQATVPQQQEVPVSVHNGREGPAPARQQAVVPAEKRILKEFVPLAAAVEAAKRERTATNFGKMEAAWRVLPEREKKLVQKSVLWASCAMLLSKGNTEAVAKRRAFVDTQELVRAVTESCRACGGTGHCQERCRECGGTGRCSFCRGSGHTPGLNGRTGACPKCNSTGRCLACAGGMRQVKCLSCSGSGRTLSETKCRQVVDENLDHILQICHGEE